MRASWVLFGVLLLGRGLWADSPYAPYQGIEAKGWLKDAAAVVVESKRDFHLEKDGSTLFHQHTVWKILTPAGARAFSELKAFYKGGETITALHAETINPDGVIQPDSEADKILSAPVQQWAPVYTDLHVRSITMPAVRVGSVLVMDVDERLQSTEFPGASWYQSPPFSIPVIHQETEVEVPAGVHFDWYRSPSSPSDEPVNSAPAETRHVEKSASGETVYRFDWEHIPGPIWEAAAPPPPPPFLFSTIASWSDVGRWYWRLADPQAQPDDEIRAKVTSLTRGIDDDQERMRELYSFVASHIRYVSLSFGIGAYRPHKASEVLKNNYGDCKDKAALLIAMLRAVGIDARFVLVDTASELERTVAAPAQFDHAIVAIPQKQGYLFLDPTSAAVDFGSLPVADSDRNVLLVEPDAGTLVRTPPIDIDQMATSETDQIQVNSNGDAADVSDYDFGFADSAAVRLALREAGEAHRDDVEKALAFATDSHSHLVKFSAGDPNDLGHRLTMHTERRVDRAVSFDTASPRLPLWWHLSDDPDFLGAGIRRNPILLTALMPAYRQTMSVLLPAGYVPQLPNAETITNDFARFHAEYLFNSAKNQLHIEADLRPLKAEIPASRTGECVSFLKSVNDALKSSIVLQVGSGASADSISNTMRQVSSLLSARADAQAEQLARIVLKAQPDHPTVRDSIAQALLDQGKPDGAAAVLQEEINRFPNDLRAHGLLAQAELKRSQLPAALNAVEAQLQKTPYDAAMRELDGQIRLLQGDAAGALKAYAEAVRIDPVHPAGYVGQGEAQLRLGMVDGARQSFSTAAGSDQVSRQQLQQMAKAMFTAGSHLDSAQTYAQRALFLLQDQIHGNRIEDLTRQGRQALRDLPDLLRLLADLAALQKRFEESLQMLNVAVTMRPENLSLLEDAAEVAIQAGKPEQAFDYLAAAMKVPGAGTDLFSKLNQAYRQLPDHSLPINIYLVKNAATARLQCGSIELDAAPAVADSMALILRSGHADGSVLDRLNDSLREKIQGIHFPDLQIGGRSIAYVAGLSIRQMDDVAFVPLRFMEEKR